MTDLAPPPGFPVQDALLAFAAVESFWMALANDDDLAARELLDEATRERHGWPVEGLAASLRERLGLTLEDCRTMGVSTTVRVLRDRSWAFLSVRTDGSGQVYEEPALVRSWAWIVVQSPLGWQLSGAADVFQLGEAALVQLPLVRPPQGGLAAH